MFVRTQDMDAQAIAYEIAHETFQIFRAVTAADMLQCILSLSSKRVRPPRPVQTHAAIRSPPRANAPTRVPGLL